MSSPSGMPNWHVGQKIVCINAGLIVSPYTGRLMAGTGLKKGAVYTITAITNPPRPFIPGLQLAEVPPLRGKFGFWAPRFRPLVERKTDISVFTAMLNNAPAPVLEDVSVEVVS